MDSETPTESTTDPVCYRHPDRVTYLACSECGKSICPDCSYDSAVGQKCAECAKTSGRARVVTARGIQNQRTPVVMTIIAATVLIYLGQRTNGQITSDFLLAKAPVQNGEWWRAITSAFLHDPGFLLHIGFNMYLLYILGPRMERQVGAVAFTGLYLSSAMLGSAAFVYLSDGAAVGASGAVFGLFGAVLIGTYPARHTPAGGAQFRQLVVLIGLNLAIPFFIPNVAWQAHVGGLIAGVLIVLGWQRIQPGPQAFLLRAFIAYVPAVIGLLLILAI
jgi:membrane associated rhomboid family serine protease